MEQRNSNKTIMSSVLFLDIVEYSKESVVGQISLKERFNRFLQDALSSVPEADRIILDTGDGAAVSFISDIEEALNAALSMRDNLVNQEQSVLPNLRVRMGINLGPVRLVRDINGQPNIVGDGINVAQRIMAFAGINQILLSRSYHDAVARLSSQYEELFVYKGSQTDKHVREHEVYAVIQPGEEAVAAVDEVAAEVSAASAETKSRMPLYLIGGLAAIGLTAVFLFGSGEKEATQEQQTPVPLPELNVSGVSATPAASASAVSVQPSANDRGKPVADKGKPNADKGRPVVADKGKPVADTGKAGVDSGKPLPTGSKPATTNAAANPVATGEDGHITVACAEGSKVFIDGAIKGKVGSVPLSLAIPPGKHLIVVDSPNQVINQNIMLNSGQTVRIGVSSCN